MMNVLLDRLHPSFEALSAHSDLSDVGRASSRIARHVARCEQCAAVVAEIRALGDAAREEVLGAPPPELWSHIEAAAEDGTRLPPQPLSDRTRRLRFSISRSGVLLAAAAALLVLLAWPGDRRLQASGTSRLTFSPSRPVPGGTLIVRYRPLSSLKAQPRLVLVGRTLTSPQEVQWMQRLGDSVASLEPRADGMFEARVRLPESFTGMSVSVSDSVGNEIDADGYTPWLVLSGTRDGKASLTSLLAALPVSSYAYGPDDARNPKQGASVSDSLRRYFPDYPAGWINSRSDKSASAIERLIAYFQTAERRYQRFYEALWPRKNLDAERMHEMVMFANAISEPDEVNRWARRLALEHPEDPRALDDLVIALHQVELKEPPALADSMRAWLPVMERVYDRGPHRVADGYAVRQFATRYGDSATVARWGKRTLDTFLRYWDSTYVTSPSLRVAAERQWLEALRTPCALPRGKFPMSNVFGSWLRICERDRSFGFTFLARARLLDGDPRSAREFSDSALATRPGQACGRWYAAYLAATRADLALADTQTAFGHLATVAGFWPDRRVIRDSARVLLGARFHQSEFDLAADSARRVYIVCAARERATAKAREDR